MTSDKLYSDNDPLSSNNICWNNSLFVWPKYALPSMSLWPPTWLHRQQSGHLLSRLWGLTRDVHVCARCVTCTFETVGYISGSERSSIENIHFIFYSAYAQHCAKGHPAALGVAYVATMTKAQSCEVNAKRLSCFPQQSSGSLKITLSAS